MVVINYWGQKLGPVRAKTKEREVESLIFGGTNTDEIRNFVGLKNFYIGPKNNVELYCEGNVWRPLSSGQVIIKKGGIIHIISQANFYDNYDEIIDDIKQDEGRE